jgi:hypothetical protein
VENRDHTYKEGIYDAKIIGTILNGKRTEVVQRVVVSLKRQKKLVVTIENDLSVSKK